jgi:hypothetical protein
MRAVGACLALAIGCVTAAAEDVNRKIWGFRDPPSYPKQVSPLICNELVGATTEQTAVLRAECERQGHKWQGRMNWTPFAHKKQRELEEAAAKGDGL